MRRFVKCPSAFGYHIAHVGWWDQYSHSPHVMQINDLLGRTSEWMEEYALSNVGLNELMDELSHVLVRDRYKTDLAREVCSGKPRRDYCRLPGITNQRYDQFTTAKLSSAVLLRDTRCNCPQFSGDLPFLNVAATNKSNSLRVVFAGLHNAISDRARWVDQVAQCFYGPTLRNANCTVATGQYSTFRHQCRAPLGIRPFLHGHLRVRFPIGQSRPAWQ